MATDFKPEETTADPQPITSTAVEPQKVGLEPKTEYEYCEEHDLTKCDKMQLEEGWEVVETLRQKDEDGDVILDRPVYHILRRKKTKS